jgi:hypothetical protein
MLHRARRRPVRCHRNPGIPRARRPSYRATPARLALGCLGAQTFQIGRARRNAILSPRVASARIAAAARRSRRATAMRTSPPRLRPGDAHVHDTVDVGQRDGSCAGRLPRQRAPRRHPRRRAVVAGVQGPPRQTGARAAPARHRSRARARARPGIRRRARGAVAGDDGRGAPRCDPPCRRVSSSAAAATRSTTA